MDIKMSDVNLVLRDNEKSKRHLQKVVRYLLDITHCGFSINYDHEDGQDLIILTVDFSDLEVLKDLAEM